MATVTKNLKEGASAPLTHIGGHKMVAENLLDFSATGFNVAGSDVVQALIIPAGAIVTSVTCEVRTAEGGSGGTACSAQSDSPAGPRP